MRVPGSVLVLALLAMSATHREIGKAKSGRGPAFDGAGPDTGVRLGMVPGARWGIRAPPGTTNRPRGRGDAYPIVSGIAG